jgi:hypothetical protein
MAIILKANKVNLFVSSVLFVFWYHSPNFLDNPRMVNAQPFLGPRCSFVNPQPLSSVIDFFKQNPSGVLKSSYAMLN